jgi:hypothetical protein
MSWIPDLAHCTYFPRPTEKLIAAGWLESGHEYPTGELRDEVVFQLMELLVAPWQPVIMPGLHNCTLCPDHYDQLRTFARNFSFQHYFVQMGCQNLFISGDGTFEPWTTSPAGIGGLLEGWTSRGSRISKSDSTKKWKGHPEHRFKGLLRHEHSLVALIMPVK